MSHVEYHEHAGRRYMYLTTGLNDPTLILDVTLEDRKPEWPPVGPFPYLNQIGQES